MSSLFKNILVFAGLAAVAYAGYYIFILNNESTLSSSSSSEGQMLTMEFLKRLNDLERINLSGAIFADPRFRSLVDFSTDPEPVPAGQANPFSAR